MKQGPSHCEAKALYIKKRNTHFLYYSLLFPQYQPRLIQMVACTCPIAFRCEFRRVNDSVDGGLSNSVLLLQEFDGLPKFIQFRVLQTEDEEKLKPREHLQSNVHLYLWKVGTYLLFCSQGETLQSEGHIAQTLLKRCHQVSLQEVQKR